MKSQIYDIKLSEKSSILSKEQDKFSISNKLWNSIFTPITPSYIIQPANEADISKIIVFAKQNGHTVAIRSGGHGFHALSTIQNGIVIDLQKMKNIQYSVDQKDSLPWVKVQCGNKFGDVDRFLWENAPGFSCLSGMDQSIGFSGACLGVGQGFRQREIGLGVDNILSMNLVLADGSIVTASENNHSDLFWALRGNASNFGIVTSITVRLHPINQKQEPEAFVGSVFWPLSVAKTVFSDIIDWTHEPDYPNSLFFNPVLETKNGIKGMALLSVHYPHGDIFHAESIVQRLKSLVTKHHGQVLSEWKWLTHLEVQTKVLNFPKDMNWYNSGVFLEQSSQLDTIGKLINHFDSVPNDYSVIAFYQLGGVIKGRSISNTCFPSAANNEWDSVFFSAWLPDDKNGSECRKWVRDGFENILVPGATHGYYNGTPYDRVNPKMHEFIFGTQNCKQQLKIKSKYDPDNFFKHSFNIHPTIKGEEESTSIKTGILLLEQVENRKEKKI